MKIDVVVVVTTPDVSDGAHQVMDAFQNHLRDHPIPATVSLTVDHIRIALVLANALAAPPSLQASARFIKADNKIIATAQVQFYDWVSADWHGRVAAFADAMARSIKAVSRTRITDADRRAVLEHILATTASVVQAQPPEVAATLPTYVRCDPDGSAGRIAFGGTSIPIDSDMVSISGAEAIRRVVASRSQEDAATPSLFKLYLRSPDGLLYFEAWPDDCGVKEHSGRCGETGATMHHAAASDREKLAILARLQGEARVQGYRPIAMSRHARIRVTASIRTGGECDVTRRHAVEDLLDQALGWSGLGHCDGGEIGSGSVDVICSVVDRASARLVITEALQRAGHLDFRIAGR